MSTNRWLRSDPDTRNIQVRASFIRWQEQYTLYSSIIKWCNAMSAECLHLQRAFVWTILKFAIQVGKVILDCVRTPYIDEEGKGGIPNVYPNRVDTENAHQHYCDLFYGWPEASVNYWRPNQYASTRPTTSRLNLCKLKIHLNKNHDKRRACLKEEGSLRWFDPYPSKTPEYRPQSLQPSAVGDLQNLNKSEAARRIDCCLNIVINNVTK